MPPKQASASHDAELREQLAMLTTRLETMQLEIDTLRSQGTTRSPGPPSVESLQLVKEPTVSKPDPFSGTEHEDLLIFLQQCELSFELQPSRFPTDYYKVGFILSYLRGPAARWARPYLMNKNHDLRNDLVEFTTAIEGAFGDPTRQFRATSELHALKQNTMTVARYAAEFQAIASHLSWNDEALCSQFYEGLADTIKDEIAKNPPATLKEFITAATRIDNRRIERPRIPVVRPEIKPPISFVEPLRPPSKLKKLDDEERAHCLAEGLCFVCREKGHTSAGCPKRSDKQPGVYSVMLSADPSEKPTVLNGPLRNFALKTGPREADVRWTTGSS